MQLPIKQCQAQRDDAVAASLVVKHKRLGQFAAVQGAAFRDVESVLVVALSAADGVGDFGRAWHRNRYLQCYDTIALIFVFDDTLKLVLPYR